MHIKNGLFHNDCYTRRPTQEALFKCVTISSDSKTNGKSLGKYIIKCSYDSDPDVFDLENKKYNI